MSTSSLKLVVERLLDAPTALGHPCSSHLGDGVRELRFILGHDGNKIRITYWLTSDRRIVLLTVSVRPDSVRTHRSSEHSSPRKSARNNTSRPPPMRRSPATSALRRNTDEPRTVEAGSRP